MKKNKIEKLIIDLVNDGFSVSKGDYFITIEKFVIVFTYINKELLFSKTYSLHDGVGLLLDKIKNEFETFQQVIRSVQKYMKLI